MATWTLGIAYYGGGNRDKGHVEIKAITDTEGGAVAVEMASSEAEVEASGYVSQSRGYAQL
jgi:hypothetical protein